ncbi:TetR family transcriptional regulator [Butyricicoccus pullicaecorum]|uniref:TetR family transcriptional regulator n=1 Tax=Butyricicoccus pullicaecorum TaxID=501571 RepID=A0A1Y4LCD4_9FIRM|nr:TetR/AcrR family transcriptional regulator [Butyricicoccus pullicaecorum]OUP53159.1 TetR family transcriptional regulator [Butyricicoccus pullicaecorum]
MKKSESKYFNTALRMDQAFLELLEKKDMEYITVKEICEAAGVNRSTFYLPYETIGDLLAENIQYMNEQFLEHMKLRSEDFISKIQQCPLDELYLVTPEFLRPYLAYIAQNKRLFRIALKNSGSLGLDKTYSRMMEHVFIPILERFQIAEADRSYILTFYIHGLMAIISEWLKNDCTDSIGHVSAVMEQCVMRERGKQEKSK